VSFNYYEAYRTEPEASASDTLRISLLRGASNVEGHNWVFFGSDLDAYKIFMPTFNVVKARQLSAGVVEAFIETGNPQPERVQFIPLTVEWIRAHPEQYGWISQSALAQLDQPGMMSLFFTGLIPEWYVEQFGPPEEIDENFIGD